MNNSILTDRLREKVRIIPENIASGQSTDEIVRMVKRLYSRHVLVPVLCEDMYEYRNPETGECLPLHSYMVESVMSRCGKVLEMTEKDLQDIVDGGYYGMSLLEARMGRDIFEDLFNSVIDEDNRLYEGIGLKKEVVEFLKVCDFPLIITTSCFPILEKELGGQYRSYWRELEVKNDAPLPEKCIYHIMGEARPENPNWGYNDKQLLRFLRSAYSDYPLKNLTSVIGQGSSRQTLLILGNNAPDWLFRFILTPIYGGDVYDDSKGYYMSEDGHNENGGLNQFLQDIKFEKEYQLLNVLKNVTARIRNAADNVKQIDGCKFDFFVAHASEDEETVRKLVARLRSEGLIVWVDYESIKDGYYWQRIMDAVNDSTYFMPFVTASYIKKTADKKTVQEKLETIKLSDVSTEWERWREFAESLDGVQVELLMAAKLCRERSRDGYSVPVVLAGEQFYEEPLTNKRIENWGKESRRLPKELFWGVQMYEFDALNPESFELEWNRYKSSK